MTATAGAPPRIATLDVVRGVAVMGILAMNIVAFAMPFPAYMNPYAYGMESGADLASWIFSFIFIDGKMRGLFSLLFGASMLLVLERAEAAGESADAIHFRRMAWLLAFGLAHFYLLWWGDILALYAAIGMAAWFFHRKPARALIGWGVGLVLAQFLLFALLSVSFFAASEAAAAPGASAEAVRSWARMKSEFALLSAEELAATLALYRGGYQGILEHQLTEELFEPLKAILLFGCETLAYMLFGMAALKNGFLAGAWPARRYRRAALIGFAIGVPGYGLLAWLLWRDGFGVPMLFALSIAATVLIRPAMVAGLAALVILATRRGGAWVDRVAAAGRAAFTNYLGTSLVMTAFFYGWGLGLYGRFARAELWLVVAAMWALMLLWSKPWLDHYRYGPFEWLWRSLARGRLQPMRRGQSLSGETASS
ncbi:MAG TPA: DUF418 domain-containing protein [Allosphingosinicella sp.]|nr:DUF418 domain-containing protein [Allosphingosinicella sp.]